MAKKTKTKGTSFQLKQTLKQKKNNKKKLVILCFCDLNI